MSFTAAQPTLLLIALALVVQMFLLPGVAYLLFVVLKVEPVFAHWAIATLVQTGQVVPLQFGKVFEVVGVIPVPVAIGMVVSSQRPAFGFLVLRRQAEA